MSIGVARAQLRLQRLEALQVGVDRQAIGVGMPARRVGGDRRAHQLPRLFGAGSGGRRREGRLTPGMDEAGLGRGMALGAQRFENLAVRAARELGEGQSDRPSPRSPS